MAVVMQHKLPDTFYKIRYSAIMAVVYTQILMEQCPALPGKINTMPIPEDWLTCGLADLWTSSTPPP